MRSSDEPFVPPEHRGGYQPDQGKRFSKSDIKLVAFGAIAVLTGIFVGQNVDKVPVHLVFVKAKIRLIWVFLLCVGLGIVLDRLLTWKGVLPAARKRRVRESEEPDQ